MCNRYEKRAICIFFSNGFLRKTIYRNYDTRLFRRNRSGFYLLFNVPNDLYAITLKRNKNEKISNTRERLKKNYTRKTLIRFV